MSKKFLAGGVAVHRMVTKRFWIQAGVVNPLAFAPKPGEDGQISLLDRGKDAANALQEWVDWMPTYKVHGVLTLAVSDFNAVGVPVIDDDRDPKAPLPSHVSADFGVINTGDDLVLAYAELAAVAVVS